MAASEIRRADRRRRGPPPLLELDQILTVALRLLDRHGASGFNMRTLAAELGVSTMTIYNYVPTKSALITSAIDHVLGQVGPPEADAEQWESELRRYARQAWDTQAPHPWIPTLLAEQHIVDRPLLATGRRALVALFRQAGADEDDALYAVAAFYSFMIGSFVQIRLTASGQVPERANSLFDAGVDILLAGFRTRFNGVAAT